MQLLERQGMRLDLGRYSLNRGEGRDDTYKQHDDHILLGTCNRQTRTSLSRLQSDILGHLLHTTPISSVSLKLFRWERKTGIDLRVEK